ncbi:MAG: hypothetical protein LC111_10760 [Bacteroidia bacterium]|nr:hypothetical protein [Bacteroidia bacterium]
MSCKISGGALVSKKGKLTGGAYTSGLPKENLILLSKNKRLDLSYQTNDLLPTNDFEKLLTRLTE